MIIIPITGIIGWDTTAEGVREALKAANGDPVKMVVTSGGGFVSTGIDIFNQFRNYPGEVHAELSGYAMSMASYIPLAADKGRITAQDNAVYMIHNTRGFVGGDHKQILKAGNYMKGLSGILAARYVKRTGKTLDEISDMMDEETFFFGQEMLDAGFVDAIIDTDEEEEDRAAALAMAQSAFEEVEARMKSDPTAVKADLERAAAMFSEMQQPTAAAHPPAKAGKPKEEEQQMALAKLLSDNPAAKAEYEANLAAARAEGETSGQAAMTATIAKVAPYLNSKEYPPIVGTTALNVLKGESQMMELTSSVAAVDAVREDVASRAAAACLGVDTIGAQTSAPRADGEPASTQADLDAEIAAYRAEEG